MIITKTTLNWLNIVQKLLNSINLIIYNYNNKIISYEFNLTKYNAYIIVCNQL
jgi:hypothetical protein